LASKLLKAKKKESIDVSDFTQGIISGNRTVLSRAITLIESNRKDHQEKAGKIVSQCMPYTGKAIRIGITGVPGAGKSTFIERFGTFLTSKSLKLAVLAVDPSSERSRGSILGDKTRMEQLSANPAAYIRPSPSGGNLGGVARKTREAMYLCEAAGFDIILVETVGVGQSETAVRSMVDFFLLLILAGAGDELQGIKRGIMEMADLIAINKADGNNLKMADIARQEYANALHMFPPPASGWVPGVQTCSALEGSGIKQIWEQIEAYVSFTRNNGFWDTNRSEQALYWMHQTISNELGNRFYDNPIIRQSLENTEHAVLSGTLDSFSAANSLLELFYHSDKK